MVGVRETRRIVGLETITEEDVLSGRDGVSDASMLAELTHVPSLVWGLGWSLIALALLVVFRKTVIGS